MMTRCPHLVIDTRNAKYSVDITWMVWDANRLLGLALTGPEVTVTGASAWILSHLGKSSQVQIQAPTEADPADPTASWPYWLHLDDSHWIRRTSSVTWAPRQRWHQAILLPADVLTPPLGTEPTTARRILHWGDPERWTDTVWQHLNAESVPLDPSWQTAFFTHLEEAGLLTISRAHQWALAGTPGPTLIQMSGLDHLEEYVRHGIRAGWFPIPEGFGPNPETTLDEHATPDDYLLAWAPALGRQLDQLVVPRVQAGAEAPAEWAKLGRTPFPAQGDVIQALSATLEDENSALLVGEQGTGKTLMMGTIPWDLFQRRQHREAYRVLLVAPDHLMAKWQREIEATIPGSQATVIGDWREVISLPKRWAVKPTHPEYWLIGRDRAKLSYGRRFSGVWRERRGYWACPDCGEALRNTETGVLWPKVIATRTQTNRACPSCGTPLWAAHTKELRRMSPMAYLARYATKRCDLAIFDEVHELKGATEQGQVLALGQRVAKKLLAGTGTLGSGFADDLSLIQYRIHPQSMVAENLQHGDLMEVQRRYGRIQTTTHFDGVDETDDDHKYGRTARVRRTQKRLPGLSPLWFATKLVDRTAFIRLDDLGHDTLPAYTEEVQWVGMVDDQAQWYRSAINRIQNLAKEALQRGSSHLLGKLLAMSLTLADEPWLAQTVAVDRDVEPQVWTPPESLTEDRRYPKEEQIVNDILVERQAGRRVWVYTTYTMTHPQSERLAKLCRAAGLRVAVMTQAVKRTQREVWVQQKLAQNVDVVISHPQLVETGLDLLEFPSIFWYSTGYNLFRLRQASRRSWRIGQTAPCLVRFYAYQETMEETALQWMADKLAMAQALEGDLNLEGLQRITEQHGGGNELARALVDGLHNVVDVSTVWQKASVQMPRPTAKPLAPAAPDDLFAYANSHRDTHREPIALTTRAAKAPRGQKPKESNQLAWGF